MMMPSDTHLSPQNVKALLGKVHFQIKVKEEINAFSQKYTKNYEDTIFSLIK